MTSPGQADVAGAAALRWGTRRGFLLGLTAAAGWLDTLAFLHLGKVFISFMSGNLLFVGIAAGDGNGALLARAGAVLATFLVATAAGALLTGSRVAPEAEGLLGRALLIEGLLLAVFGVLWLTMGKPAGHPTTTFALLVVGAAAMGLQAAISLSFHLPNVATVALTGTFAQLGALIGWRVREGRPVVAETPAVSLMVPLCLAYLVSAVIVAAVPESPAMAFGPVVLFASAVAIESANGR
jgi:uncharacterized membrane protein YoaK (UPF0700 family)